MDSSSMDDPFLATPGRGATRRTSSIPVSYPITPTARPIPTGSGQQFSPWETPESQYAASPLDDKWNDPDFRPSAAVEQIVGLVSLNGSTVWLTPKRPEQKPYRPPSLSTNEELVAQLQGLSGGKICLVTRERQPAAALQICHLLPRATCQTQLDVFDRLWKAAKNEINVDSTLNLVYLRADIHLSFDAGDFGFLPSLEVLQVINKEMNIKPKERKPFNQVFQKNVKHTYTVLPLTWWSLGVTTLIREDHRQYKLYTPAYDEGLPEVQSHMHPYFAVANLLGKPVDDFMDEISALGGDLPTRLYLLNAILISWQASVGVPSRR